MSRSLLGSTFVLSFIVLAACSDPDSVSGSRFERGIDADISATHDAGAPTTRNLGLRDQSPLPFGPIR